MVLPLPLYHLENHVCLSRGVQVADATWWAATRIVAGVGDLMQRIGDGRTDRVLGGRTIGRSGDAVCGLHRARGAQVSLLSLKTKVNVLSVVWPQNHWDGFSRFGLKTGGVGFPGLGLKTGSNNLVIWPSKLLRQFLDLGLKTKWAVICRLRLKTGGRMRRRGTSVEI
jgi:hypothetical protein